MAITNKEIIEALELAVERLEMNNIENSEQEFINKLKKVIENIPDELNVTIYLNEYTCPECGFEWSDESECTNDDDCPECGCRHVSPDESEV